MTVRKLKSRGKQKPSTAQLLGGKDFKPWGGEFNAAEFTNAMETHRVNGHMAIAIMHKPKQKLMDSFREIPDEMQGLTEDISTSIDGLRALADAMDAARLRLLSACAAVYLPLSADSNRRQ